MQLTPLHITRKILAFFLTALLVFVQLVKLVHHHPDQSRHYASLQHQGLHDPQLLSSHACDICDFQLATAAAVPDFISTPDILSSPYKTQSAFITTWCSGIQQAHANKGPPAV
ncbi:hypothetical protein [Chitinophaga qingshengii]|uniref:DUF2607 family protein n=1 Tax=Chitinophaga qingshengii TaxID=1569794 RepID=A0ABR7TNF3_9BACT|nr:hypothetical protein [Chitinophaga qingshengii]MBC9932014.1 hypothetical protein [Chitinophaga qingshengii]